MCEEKGISERQLISLATWNKAATPYIFSLVSGDDFDDPLHKFLFSTMDAVFMSPYDDFRPCVVAEKLMDGGLPEGMAMEDIGYMEALLLPSPPDVDVVAAVAEFLSASSGD